MVESARPKEAQSVTPASTRDLESFALEHEPACWLNRPTLAFDPLGLPAGLNPYETEPKCSTVAAVIEKRLGMPACNVEAPVAQAFVEVMGAALAARLTGPGRPVWPPLPVVTTPPAGKLTLLRQERIEPPRSVEPPLRSELPPAVARRQENDAYRANLLRTNPTFSTFEEHPWTYVHSIRKFPVVEIRRPGSSKGKVLVYDRTGSNIIFDAEFLVAAKRHIMKRETKERHREENLPELENVIGRNLRVLLSVRYRFEGTD